MSEENSLPSGWTVARVTDIANVVEPGFPHGNYNTVGIGFPQLRPMNIDGQGRLCLGEIKYVDIDSPPLLQSGDILFNNTNSPVWVGKTTIISQGNRFTFSNHMTRVRLNPHAGVPQFFALQLQYLQQSGYFKARCNHHVNQASISSSYLSGNVDLLMASLPEQHRIVTAIEQQFTRLDAAVTALQHAKTKLKRYRIAVLKAAVEGKLTEAWRAERPATEPASALLERILVERRVKWDADLRAKGKDPAKVKYVEPTKPDAEDLPSLPEGWCWATVEQISQIQGGIQKQPSRAPKENAFPYLRVANVLRGRLDLSVIEKMELFGDELNTLRLKMGDLLIVEGNGSRTEIGRSALWKDEIKDCIHQNHIIRVRLNTVLPEYLDFYWNSPIGNKRVTDVAASTSGLHTLSVGKISRLPAPLPPIAEQQEIVSEVERRLSIVTQLEATVNANLKRAEWLRQSILKEAFAGRLVPQDPNDEPASMLLERIHKEREEQKPGPIKKSRELKTISVSRMPDVEPIDINTSGMEQMDLWASTGSRE